MTNAQQAIQQAKQALQQAQQNTFGSVDQLERATAALKECMNSTEAGEKADQLRDIHNAVQQACNACKEPHNQQAIENSVQQAMRACEQADTIGGQEGSETTM
ncbi:hypothetical protein [Falsibacillus albus]|uniref:DUF2564 family protein n=1 Tax=Falsibacillus albus TaxID=2478915 RepID=A0A3L7JZ55_9BACI|nr:hypothetical protein [Falsibacillus albus]RLQ95409.1 hypothetical protein D9X91_10255 [Falsibacillus albus]